MVGHGLRGVGRDRTGARCSPCMLPTPLQSSPTYAPRSTVRITQPQSQEEPLIALLAVAPEPKEQQILQNSSPSESWPRDLGVSVSTSLPGNAYLCSLPLCSMWPFPD